jgi:hypothetical protein
VRSDSSPQHAKPQAVHVKSAKLGEKSGAKTDSSVSFSAGGDLHEVVCCLEKLERLWGPRETGTELSEKDKQAQSTLLLERCFAVVDNPWSAALVLLQSAKDYSKAKTSSLAYFCMRTFSK